MFKELKESVSMSHQINTISKENYKKKNQHKYKSQNKKRTSEEFSGGPLVGTQHFRCCGPGSIPSWELGFHKPCGVAKKEKELSTTTEMKSFTKGA